MLKRIGAEESGEFKAIASGTLPSGKPVIINADGTVTVVSETTAAGGTPVAFDSGTIRYTSVAYDSANEKIVIVYEDSSNSEYGTAIVGTVNPSDNSISFGTAVVFESADMDNTAIAYDANAGKVVIAYRDKANSNQGTAIVGTVSGTSISFGTSAVFENGNTDYISVVYDSNAQKVVVSYSDVSDSSRGKSVVGTISGTSISFGSVTQFGNAFSYSCTSVFDSTNNKVVALWRDINDSNKGKANVGTVSGTSISFGGEVTFEAGAADEISADFDTSSGKVIIAFFDADNSNKGTAIVGTVSGTSISFGTAVIFNDASTTFTTTTYNPVANKTFIAFKDAGNSNYLTAILGTVSGTSISFGSETVLDQVNGLELGSAYDSSQDRIVVSYRNSTDSEGSSVVFRTGSANLTSENYIGMSKGGAVADTKGATVDIIGAVAKIPEVYYDLANAAYDSVNFSVASQSSYTFDFSFADSGTKLYAQKQFNGGTIYQYTLSSAYDLSTASYANKSYSFANGESGFVITPDGSTLYISANTGDAVYRYTFGTAFDVSTLGSGTSMFSTSSVDTQPDKCKFNSNGTKFFLLGRNNKRIYEYAVSTAYDLSSASYSNNSLLLSGQAAAPLGFNFNSDGTKLFVSDNTTDTIFQYNLSTAYDITSASYSNISFSVAGQDSTPSGIDFNSTGSKLFILGNSSNTVYQYNTETSLTAGQQYFVQTDGTISTTADDPSVLAGTAISATELLVKT